MVGELSVPYTCPSRLTTRHATHVTPFSPCSVSVTHARDNSLHRLYHLARMDIHHVHIHTRPHTATHGHAHTRTGRTSAHDTTTATTVRIPTDMSRRRRRRLSRWRAGGRRSACGNHLSGGRQPVQTCGVRKVRSCPVRVHSWTLCSHALYVRDRRASFVLPLCWK